MTATATIQESKIPVTSYFNAAKEIGRITQHLPKSQQAVHDRILDRLQEPSSILALIGHAGMGKSTLLRDLALHLETQAHVLMPATPYSSFDEFIDALNVSLGGADTKEETLTVEHHCRNLTDAGTPLVLLIDNALAWPPFLLIELAVLSRSTDLRLVLADRPGLALHTETLGISPEDVRELVPFTRAEMDSFARLRLVNPTTGAPRNLRSGASDRIWYYTGGMPHLASLLCDKLVPVEAGNMDMPTTADQVDIVAGEIGLAEREYLDSISSPAGNDALGEGAPRRRALSALNNISLVAASISALAVVSIVVALQYSQPQNLMPEFAVWGDQPVERLAEEFASLGGTLDQPLVDAVEKPPAPLTAGSEAPVKYQKNVYFLASNANIRLTADASQEVLIASQPASDTTGQPDSVVVARDLTTMLEEAKVHMEARRYTLPAGKNAFDIYSRILNIDPSNDQAIRGLQTIHAAYLSWGKEATKNQEWLKATGHFRKAVQVLPGNQESKILLQEAKTRVSWLMTFQKLADASETVRVVMDAKPDDYEWMDRIN